MKRPAARARPATNKERGHISNDVAPFFALLPDFRFGHALRTTWPESGSPVSGCFDRIHRADVDTGAAIDTSVSIDDTDIALLSNATHRTDRLTGTAIDTVLRNCMGQNPHLLPLTDTGMMPETGPDFTTPPLCCPPPLRERCCGFAAPCPQPKWTKFLQ